MRVFLSGIAILLSVTCSAQMISVMKAGTKKRRLYHPMEFIKVKTADTEYSGELFYISDSILIIGDQAIHPDSIVKVYDYSSGGFAGRLGDKLIAGGVFYFLLTTVNRAGNGDSPVFTDYNLQISTALAVSGIIIGQFRKRVFRMNRRGRLSVLNP